MCNQEGGDEQIHTGMDYLLVRRPQSITSEGVLHVLESALNALSIQEMTARVYETSGCRYRGRRASRLDFLDVVHGTPFRAGPERCPQGDAPATILLV